MYQFYYAQPQENTPPRYARRVDELMAVTAVRPTMWEEHCLECAAPLCFHNCSNYIARSDGRCQRFYNGIAVRDEARGCCGQAARIRFRPWANLMTVLFPSMLSVGEYQHLTETNLRLGKSLRGLNNAPLPRAVRWQGIRTAEYLRRRRLRRLKGGMPEPDAFLFHGFSFEPEAFRLVLEIYHDNKPVFKSSLALQPGENLFLLRKAELSAACWQEGNLLKIYPENNREAELEILWCDFVQGKPTESAQSADKVKCVVWDLDNTLWDGILIETDEPETLSLRPGVRELIKTLDERGILQSIASKNDHDAAWPILEKLGLSEYFLYPQIHWGAKSASLRAIAESLNIGIDSLALLDDSEYERRQVQDTLPCVRCYGETEIPALASYPEMDTLITPESRGRRLMYQAEERRSRMMREENADTISFLRKCHLRIRIFTPHTQEELLRCYELVNRTNQLNMSGRKYTEDSFEEVLRRTGHRHFAFSCEDDFGAYGIVGFGQYRIEGEALVFSEFAMSCRVAGKYVESALFSELLESENCSEGIMTVIKTKKNSLLRRTLEEIGFKKSSEESDSIKYSFDKELMHADIVETVCT